MERRRELNHGEAIEALTANRLDDLVPFLHLQEWAEDSRIEEVYGISPDSLNDDRFGSGALGYHLLFF